MISYSVYDLSITTLKVDGNIRAGTPGKSIDDRIPRVDWVDEKTYDGSQCDERSASCRESNKAAIDIGDCCSNIIHLFLPSKSEKVMLSMLEQLHAEPMKGSFFYRLLLAEDRHSCLHSRMLSGLSFPIPTEGTLSSRGAVVLFVLHAVVVVRSSAWWRVLVLFSGHHIAAVPAGTVVLFFLSEVCALLFVLALLLDHFFRKVLRLLEFVVPMRSHQIILSSWDCSKTPKVHY
ncbi:hypothetical protein V8G54_020431 [Vigna mungo]|uniref:Uncharacterized protein n=1 Tax=Vigna mungo TaxID=3915 RepID=A0AAQ3NC78_VIGMU